MSIQSDINKDKKLVEEREDELKGIDLRSMTKQCYRYRIIKNIRESKNPL